MSASPEESMGKVNNWSDMKSILPMEDVNKLRAEKLLRGYFRSQLLLSRGKKVKAERLIRCLDRYPEFRKLEDEHEYLFKAIDYAVKGSTNRINEPGGYRY